MALALTPDLWKALLGKGVEEAYEQGYQDGQYDLDEEYGALSLGHGVDITIERENRVGHTVKTYIFKVSEDSEQDRLLEHLIKVARTEYEATNKGPEPSPAVPNQREAALHEALDIIDKMKVDYQAKKATA